MTKRRETQTRFSQTRVGVWATILVVFVAMIASPSTSSALEGGGACYGFGPRAYYSYSVGFSTCGSASGVRSTLTRGAGNWNSDPCTNCHVNATIWMIAADGDLLEMGYWRGPGPGPGPGQDDLGRCFYAAEIDGGVFTGYCVAPADNFDSVTLAIRTSPGSSAFKFYRNGFEEYTIQADHVGYNVVMAGAEEQSLNVATSPAETPNVTYGALDYVTAGTTPWKDWGTSTHCYVQYSAGNTFGALNFPVAMKAAINQSAGTYGACNGNPPTTPRTNW